jgi:hypothetical protein
MADGQQDNQVVLRLSPTLAAEIGLNESIVLMQVQYLTSISEYQIDGEKWIRGSLPELIERYFPFLSPATLSRVFHSLERAGLLHVGRFNKFKYDRTQWFRLNVDNCTKLNGFYIFQNERSILQNDGMHASKMKDACEQNEITIREEIYSREIYQGEIQGEEGESAADAASGADAPAPAAPPKVSAPPKNPKTTKQPSDERTTHPAIIAYREACGKYPKKELYDRIITSLGLEPDAVRLLECRVEWVARGYNPSAATWALEWYGDGIPSARGRASPVSRSDAIVMNNLSESEKWLKRYEVTDEQPRPS